MGRAVKADVADGSPTVPHFRVAAELTSLACRVDAVMEGGADADIGDGGEENGVALVVKYQSLLYYTARTV